MFSFGKKNDLKSFGCFEEVLRLRFSFTIIEILPHTGQLKVVSFLCNARTVEESLVYWLVNTGTIKMIRPWN